MDMMNDKKMLKNWEILVNSENGMEEGINNLRVFANFWENVNDDELEMPGNMLLRGEIYGHERFPDGSRINTSQVKSVKRVERDTIHGVPHDLMCATTMSGSEYHFYSDEWEAHMGLLLGTLIHTV